MVIIAELLAMMVISFLTFCTFVWHLQPHVLVGTPSHFLIWSSAFSHFPILRILIWYIMSTFTFHFQFHQNKAFCILYIFSRILPLEVTTDTPGPTQFK